jgi:glycosyltransferase involved in cell wall biosynthesis
MFLESGLRVSIVTPTYNRRHCLQRSVDSSLAMINAGAADEVVIVDDASTDDSVEFIRHHYASEISQGLLKLEVLSSNLGVTGAKNRGAKIARGEWVVFMDSDDNFIVEHCRPFIELLTEVSHSDLVFFRCRDNNTKILIGPDLPAFQPDLTYLINVGTPGECLPMVRREVIMQHAYPVSLRGSESLSYFAIAAAGYSCLVSDLCLREYEFSGQDRLSNKKGVRARAWLLVKHNFVMLKYTRAMTLKTLIGVVARIGYYSLLSIQNRLK